MWPYTRLRVRYSSGAYFPIYPRSVRITGKFGWPAVPPQIAKANVIQAARYFHRRNAPLGVISFSTEVGFRMAGADADVASLVDPFALQVLF